MSDRTPEERREELIRLYHEVRDCRRCPLSATRTNAVFGMGNADADLMFVGEAPGAEEDRQGKPFVGRAGKLLDQLLADVGMERSRDVFIANVLKSRPPGNRDPQPDEIEACRPYLETQIALIEPLVICTLGNFATKLLTGSPVGITRCCGVPQERELGGRPVVIYPLFHPAAALRTPNVLERLREDFSRVPALLERERARSAAAAPESASAEPDRAGSAEPDRAGSAGQDRAGSAEPERPSALAAMAASMGTTAASEPDPPPQLGLFGSA
ncbi:MAG TPA: uracil-DNA glycosylase [Thermoleophilaceae bacterium]